eukprot:TRINITY_DN2983_c0_g1_i1.p1 TRINITY_DN2983_c0_g1~~TRINITY_DN2983_c0_g1_i1.p1  ORF type:complete len:360 (-),score=47.50 TRINITY_DN2983_c0_g1_i1:89-1168(-)
MFSLRGLRDYMTPVFVKHANALVSQLQVLSKQPEHYVDVQQLFFRHTLDCIGEIAFGVNLDSLGGSSERFSHAFDEAQLLTEQRFWQPLWQWLPRGAIKAAVKILDNFSYGLITQRRVQETDTTARADGLSLFMNVIDKEGHKLSDQFLRDIVLNLIIAGRDTTAVAMTWATYLISTHPDVEKKMLDELDTVIGDDPVDYNNVQKLVYMKAILDETLRIFPSVPVDPKVAIRDDILPTGQRIPAGSLVLWCAFAMGRLDSLFPNAAEFRPERWLPGATDGPVHTFAFIPFQAGPRRCMGESMAYLEARVVLASLYKHVVLRMKPGHKIAYKKAVTLPAKYGMMMQAVPRVSLPSVGVAN